MSTNMAVRGESSETSEDSSELDPEYECFDALKAIYSDGCELPCRNVRVYDNVQQYESYIEAAKRGTLRQRMGRGGRGRQASKSEESATAAGSGRGRPPENSTGPGVASAGGAAVVSGGSATPAGSPTVTSSGHAGPAGGSSVVTPGGPAMTPGGLAVVPGHSAVPSDTRDQRDTERLIVPGRRFTESQAPVAARKKQQRTVLTRMEASAAGPFGRLRWCMERRVKVKVYIRNYGRVRGVCTGYIVAFDKHWNLCLEDVDEIYQKKVRRKSVFLGDPALEPAAGGDAARSAPARRRAPPPQESAVARLTARLALLQPPESRRSRRRPVFETARRHVGQLFVRGDNVVLVVVADGDGAD